MIIIGIIARITYDWNFDFLRYLDDNYNEQEYITRKITIYVMPLLLCWNYYRCLLYVGCIKVLPFNISKSISLCIQNGEAWR